MGDKFRRGRRGTARFMQKHKKDFRKNKMFEREREMRERRPSRYDPDARYS